MHHHVEMNEITRLALLNHAARGLNIADDMVGTYLLSATSAAPSDLPLLHGFYNQTYGHIAHAYTTTRETRQFVTPTGLADMFDRIHASLIGFASSIGRLDTQKMRAMPEPYPQCAELVDGLDTIMAEYQGIAHRFLDAMADYVKANPRGLPIERRHVAERLSRQAQQFNDTYSALADELRWHGSRDDNPEWAFRPQARRHFHMMIADQVMKPKETALSWPASGQWDLPLSDERYEPFMDMMAAMIALNARFHENMEELIALQDELNILPVSLKLPAMAPITIELPNTPVQLGDINENRQVYPLATLVLAGLTHYGQADHADLPIDYITRALQMLGNQEAVMAHTVLPMFQQTAGDEAIDGRNAVAWGMLRRTFEKNMPSLLWVRYASLFSASEPEDMQSSSIVAAVDGLATLLGMQPGDIGLHTLPPAHRLLAAVHGLYLSIDWDAVGVGMDDDEALDLQVRMGETLLNAMEWLLEPARQEQELPQLWDRLRQECTEAFDLLTQLLQRTEDMPGRCFIRKWLEDEHIPLHRGNRKHDVELMEQFRSVCHSRIMPDNLLIQLTCPVAHVTDRAACAAGS